MKYLEELIHGETFVFNNSIWLVTSDFKNNGSRLCYSMQDGFPKWFESDCTVDVEPLYSLDENNNVLPVRKYEKQNPEIS